MTAIGHRSLHDAGTRRLAVQGNDRQADDALSPVSV
jgi:hypothetical protein